jgi:O-antigen/teichoic acid export membrane protein
MASVDKQMASGSITARIVRAAGAQGINQLARIGQLFLLVPVCLSVWGTGLYEDWLLLNSIAAFLILADFGFIQATTVRLIDSWSKGEGERFARDWAFALGLLTSLILALTCVLGALWAVPVWTPLIPTRDLHQAELAAIAELLCFVQVLTILVNLGLAAYRARGDLSRSYHVSSILVILQTAGVVVPAMLGYGPLWAAAGFCGMTLAIVVAIVVDFRWRYPDMTWKPIWPSLPELWQSLRESIGYLVSPVATTIMMNGPNLILARCGAPQGAIALFTATRTIAGVARQLPYQFAHPAGVELAGLLARGDRQRLSRVYANASRALAVTVGVLGGFILVAAPLVMALWTRGKITYDPVLMLLFVGATAICAPAQVAYMLLWYGGYPGRLSKALIFSTALAMALAYLLAPRFDARGVTAGLGIGEIVGVAVYLSLLVDRMLDRRLGTGLMRNFWATLFSLSSSAACGYLVERLIEPRDWLGLVELGLGWTVPVAAGVYLLFLNGAQQQRVTGAAVSFVRSRWAKSSAK